VTGEKQDNNINTKKQKHPKTSCRQWRRRPKTLDGGACRTRVVTGTTQTKIRRGRTGFHCARPKKKQSVALTRTKEQKAPRRVGTTHQLPTTDTIGACGDRGGRWRGTLLGGACQSEVDGKRWKNRPKIIMSTTRWLGHSTIEDILRWAILSKQKK